MEKEERQRKNKSAIVKIVDNSIDVDIKRTLNEKELLRYRKIRVEALFRVLNVSAECNVVFEDRYRGVYNPITNTLRAGKIRSLIAEVAHCKQMEESGKIIFYLRGILDWIRAPYFSKKGYSNVQYSTYGSLEYEAHKKIEKELYEYYYLLIETFEYE